MAANPRVQAVPETLARGRNKHAQFLFHRRAGLSAKTEKELTLVVVSCIREQLAGPFRGEVFEGNETKVRLDDDIQRGAVGLTADKTSKATGRDNRASGTSKRASRGADPHVASALRNAYQEAVSEDVPQEFLDLLGKLS